MADGFQKEAWRGKKRESGEGTMVYCCYNVNDNRN